MSLKVIRHVGQFSFEIQEDSMKEVFKNLAKLDEIFGNDVCGKCGGTDIKFVVRNVDDNDYYELHCKDIKCRAKLAFGQHKKGGTIFPKRKDKEEDGKYLPNNGWTVYVKES